MTSRESEGMNQRSDQQRREKRAALAFIGTGLGMTLAGIAIGAPANIIAASESRDAMYVHAEGYRNCANFVRDNHEGELAFDSLSDTMRQKCGIDLAISEERCVAKASGDLVTCKLPDGLEGEVVATAVYTSRGVHALNGIAVTLPSADNLESVAASLESQSHQQSSPLQDGLAGAGWGALAGFAGFGAIARGGLSSMARRN